MNPELGNKDFSDRRAKSRIACNCIAIVRGRNADGRVYREDARVINLSAGGIYMLLNRSIDTGEKIAVQIQLPIGSIDPGNPRLVTEGIVVREESHAAGITGIAVKINRHRFLK